MYTTDLKSIQTELKRNRENFQKAQLDFLTAKASLHHVERALVEGNRYSNEKDENFARQKDELTKRKENLESQLVEYSKAKESFKQFDVDIAGKFFVQPDPFHQIEGLRDDIPILLMPLRLETRFKIIGAQHQLWLRIFPDDCHIDTFEPLMSQYELQQIKQFWAGWFKAGGIEKEQQAAWRALVASFGSGRASWLYNNYKPLNLGSAPVKANEPDVILTIAASQPLDAGLKNTIQNFWKNWRLAEGDDVKEQQLINQLKTDAGTDANNVLENLVPVNLADPIRKDPGNVLVNVDVAFVEFQPDDSVITTSTSWTQAATVQTLPDYFVIAGYNGNVETLFKTTKYVPSVLSVSPDPSLLKDDQMKPGDRGDLNVNKDIQWLTDFDTAIEAGMGLKIDLTPAQYSAGFDKLIVVGLRFSADELDNGAMLEDLLKKHFYSKKGFSLLPQGIPTNNTEDASSGFTRADDADESFKTFIQNKTAFAIESDNYKKRDGQWFGEFLGLDLSLLQQIPFAAHTDQTDARAMNTALYPATLGFFMDEMMDTVFTDQDIMDTRNFFNQYVSGRGCIPAIRIGKQPYGILPAIRFSQLEFNQNLRGEAFPNGVQSKYLGNLKNVLVKLDGVWDSLLEKVSYVGKTGFGVDPHQVLLDVVGLHPASVEFHQRYLQSTEQVYNQVKLSFSEKIALIIADAIRQTGLDLLASWGINTSKEIPIVTNLLLGKQHPLTGPVIDI
ncbi:MAG TPA: hypothetical protein VM871_00505, partial [Flavisolibacter sp.]|nr:hypothetical protein [Flavisolibacter sp.]